MENEPMAAMGRLSTNRPTCSKCGDHTENWWNYCAMCGWHLASGITAVKTATTAAELDALLNSEDDREITINPDGSITPR